MNALRNRLREAVRRIRLRSRARAVSDEQVAGLLVQVQRLAAEQERLEREIDELRADSRRIAELRVIVERELGGAPPAA
ncbi:hypothetical protein D3248_12730 [Leucobacter zeae]|nr:hypothetical protein [Leucobacter zeae]